MTAWLREVDEGQVQGMHLVLGSTHLHTRPSSLQSSHIVSPSVMKFCAPSHRLIRGPRGPFPLNHINSLPSVPSTTMFYENRSDILSSLQCHSFLIHFVALHDSLETRSHERFFSLEIRLKRIATSVVISYSEA